MRMPVRLTAERLDGRHDPRHAVLAIERGPPAARDRLRGTARQDAEQATLPQEQPPQSLRNREDRMSVRDRRQDLLPELLREQLGALLLARRAEVPRLAGKRHEEFAAALRAPDAGEAVLRTAAVEETRDDLRHGGPKRAVLRLEHLLMHPLELGEVRVEQTVERAALGMARAIEGRRFADVTRPTTRPPPPRRPGSERRNRHEVRSSEHVAPPGREPALRQEGRLSPPERDRKRKRPAVPRGASRVVR